MGFFMKNSLYLWLSHLLSPAITIKIGSPLTINDNVLAISASAQPIAFAASSTVALDASNSTISPSLLYFLNILLL